MLTKVGLTRALVAETAGMGVRINCILPGYIDTAMITDGMFLPIPVFIGILRSAMPNHACSVLGHQQRCVLGI